MRMLASWAVFAVALALLGAVNARISAYPPDIAPIVPLGSSEIANGQPGDAPSPSEHEIRLVHSQSRPLFSPTRRPWVAPVANEPSPVAASAASAVPSPPQPDEPPPAEPPRITLLGIRKTPDQATALVSQEGAGDPLWLSIGDSIGGWTVATINPGGIEVKLADRTVGVDLYPSQSGEEGQP